MNNAARTVNREFVEMVQTPEGSDTWKPISHGAVLSITERAIHEAGLVVKGKTFQLSHEDHRMFATYQIDQRVGPDGGSSLVIGCRNSTDKEFAAAFAAGENVMVCSNGCFWGDLAVSRRNTQHCEVDFREKIAERMGKFSQVIAVAEQRQRYLMDRTITEGQAHDLICRGVKREVFAPSEAFRVLEEYESPSFEGQGTGTLWGLHNAATHVFKKRADRNPGDWLQRTQRLQALLVPTSIREQMAEQFEQTA